MDFRLNDLLDTVQERAKVTYQGLLETPRYIPETYRDKMYKEHYKLFKLQRKQARREYKQWKHKERAPKPWDNPPEETPAEFLEEIVSVCKEYPELAEQVLKALAPPKEQPPPVEPGEVTILPGARSRPCWTCATGAQHPEMLVEEEQTDEEETE